MLSVRTRGHRSLHSAYAHQQHPFSFFLTEPHTCTGYEHLVATSNPRNRRDILRCGRSTSTPIQEQGHWMRTPRDTRVELKAHPTPFSSSRNVGARQHSFQHHRVLTHSRAPFLCNVLTIKTRFAVWTWRLRDLCSWIGTSGALHETQMQGKNRDPTYPRYGDWTAICSLLSESRIPGCSLSESKASTTSRS